MTTSEINEWAMASSAVINNAHASSSAFASDSSNVVNAQPQISSWQSSQQVSTTPERPLYGGPGKRSRSNSSSSSASSASSSVFSITRPSSQTSSALDVEQSPVTSPGSSQASRDCCSPSVGSRKSRRADGSDNETAAVTATTTKSLTSDNAKRASVEVDAVASLGQNVSTLKFGDSAAISATVPQNVTVKSPASPTATQPPKGIFVDALVDAAVATLDSIWHSPLAPGADSDVSTDSVLRDSHNAVQPPECRLQAALPLQLFVRETLRRSRTSCSTLQAALLYCVRARPTVMRLRRERSDLAHIEVPATAPGASSWPSSLPPSQRDCGLLICARRMFLAATMVASKFLQDRNYSNRAWSRISGLPIGELGACERSLLSAVGYHLDVGPDEWQAWIATMSNVAEAQAAAKASNTGHAVHPTTPSCEVDSGKCSTTPKATDAILPTVASAPVRLCSAASSDAGRTTPTPPTNRQLAALANLARRSLSRTSSEGVALEFDSSLTPSPLGRTSAISQQGSGSSTPTISSSKLRLSCDTDGVVRAPALSEISMAPSLLLSSPAFGHCTPPAPFPLARGSRSKGFASGRSQSHSFRGAARNR